MQIASKMLSSTNTEMIPDDLRALVRDQNVEGAVLTEILRLTDRDGIQKGEKETASTDRSNSESAHWSGEGSSVTHR